MRQLLMITIMFALASCGGQKKNQWEDLDYSSVYRKAGERENDSGYTSPTGSCIDDDMACQ